MNKSVININKNQIILPLLLFLAVMVLTQYLAYQQYLLTKDRERTVLQNELSNVRYRFANLLETDINKANTISILYDQIGLKSDFEDITGQILKTNKSIDVIQLVNNDIITHVYPLQGNQRLVGMNVAKYPLQREESQKAIARKGVYFAGPRKLVDGGYAF